MKALCPKPGKGGKIHPSPPEDPIAAAFRLLPAAILVLVAGLCPEDQRVLAHLVARSVMVDGQSGASASSSAAASPDQARRLRREHPPTVGCVCFECYSSFWSRWDCSPQHDRIHDAMEAFEEHLAAAESSSSSSSAAAAATPPSSKRRDKGKRSSKAAASPATPPPPAPPAPPAPRARSTEPLPPAEVVQEVPSPLPLSHPPPPPPTPAPAASTSEDKENIPSPPAATEPAECGGEATEVAAAAEAERKRGWADVMGGVLNPRRWGIWSPALESAT